MSSNGTSLHVGIDLGTTSCRTCVVERSGRQVAFTSVPLPAPVRTESRVEQAPEQWWDATTRALGTVLDKVARRAVRSIAVDGTSGTLLVADERGMPLAPALMYNDQSSISQASRVREWAPADSPAQGASSALCKLMQLLERQPAAARARALHQADWIAGTLRGKHGIADENNALKLGYDPVTRSWPEWIAALGIPPSAMPSVVPAGAPIGYLSSAMAVQFGLGDDVMVVAGTTDSIAATIAAGVSSPADAVTSLGSTLVLKVVSTRPVTSAAHGVYTHRLGDIWLAGGASNTGGAVLASFFTSDELDRLSAAIAFGRPSALDYYPLVAPGERFPINDPALVPRLVPRPAEDREFLHGLLESMARIERDGYRLLNSLGAPYPKRVVTTGGGACNEAWLHIRERVLGVPVTRAAMTEAAYGAALLAVRGAP